MSQQTIVKLNKRCKAVDKYDEIDEAGNIRDRGDCVVGTIYVSNLVAKGAQKLRITVEVVE